MPIQLVLGRLVSTHLFLCFLVVFVAFSSMLVCLFACKFSRCFIFFKITHCFFFFLSFHSSIVLWRAFHWSQLKFMTNYNFNLLSLNARGIRDYLKRKSIFTWVKQQNTNIVFYKKPTVLQTLRMNGSFSDKVKCCLLMVPIIAEEC